MIGLLLPLLAQQAQGAGQLVGQMMNYGFNSALASQQNQYNIDMWKMQADYNSPQAQMRRFQDAGLNPNLIYGQGSNGNMTSAPQMVVPAAPEFSKGMEQIGKAFNIENLRTLIAHRKEAEANADNARTNERRNAYQLEAERHFGQDYDFDLSSGRFIRLPQNVIDENMFNDYKHLPYLKQMLANSYYRGSLIPYREALLREQKNYLVPQVWMANYERQHYPTSYWIGQGSKIAGGLNDVVSMFMPGKWIMNLGKRGGAYRAPGGKIYYY